MKIVQIVGNRIHWVTPWQTFEEMPEFAADMIFIEARDEVQEGWQYIDGEIIKPTPTEEPPLPLPEPSNAEIAKLMTDIYASLFIAGVI